VLAGLLGDGGGTAHVLVGRVGATADQTGCDLVLPALFADEAGKLAERRREVGSKGSVEVRFEVGKVDAEMLVVLATLVGGEER
jgi:hypothetical protein